MIYFDNAATSFPKPKSVIKGVERCLREYCGNPSRSSHELSLRASEAVYEARCSVAEHLGCKSEERVVFTYNATYALNLAIKSLVTDGCHVICSDVEHNSVIRVLEELGATRGITYSVFNSDIDPFEQIKSLRQVNTALVVSTLCSNVTGRRIDQSSLSRACRECGLLLILDASQACGHFRVRLGEIGPCVLCAPAHKSLLGVQGCGFAVFNEVDPIRSVIEGGSGSISISPHMPDMLPDMLEAGTPCVPACVGLRLGIEYISRIGIDEIGYKIGVIASYIRERLLNMPSLSLLPSEGSILSFNVRDVPSSAVAKMLDSAGICTRSGLHCAPSAHAKCGTLSQGAVRLSFSCFNTLKEASVFCDVINGYIHQA